MLIARFEIGRCFGSGHTAMDVFHLLRGCGLVMPSGPAHMLNVRANFEVYPNCRSMDIATNIFHSLASAPSLPNEYFFCVSVQDELDEVLAVWNAHRIRPSKTTCVPYGIPNAMYCTPELWGCSDYLCDVHTNDLEVCLTSCPMSTDHFFHCDADIFDICSTIMQDKQLHFPSDTWDLLQLYCTLRTELHNLLL